MTIEVEATPPFDFGHSIAFLTGFTPCAGDHRCRHRTLATGGFAGERPFVARVSETDGSSTEAPSLAVDIEWPDEPDEDEAVVTWLRDFLSLNDDLADRLGEIWGFGPWSVEFVSIRGFGRMDRVPAQEKRLCEAVAERYDLDTTEASDTDLRELSAPYDPLAGYWAHYIRVWAFGRDRECPSLSSRSYSRLA